MAGSNINSVFYAESYHPIQAGSIDGTDVLPHDNAVLRAHLCSNAGLYDPLADAKALGDPYRTVFVGRLSRLTTEQTLYKAMCRYGRIKDLRLVRDIVTGASRGYAFVEFETDREMHRAYREANHSFIDDCEIIVDYNRQRLMPGWIPRRLGGGLGGKKESGQLRFGGRERPFRAPLRPIPYEELKRLGIPPPPVGRYMPRFQIPSPPRRKRSSADREESSEESSPMEREGFRKRAMDYEVNSATWSSMKEKHYYGKSLGERLDHYWKNIYTERRDDHRRSSTDKEDFYEASITESEEAYKKWCDRDREEHGRKSRSAADREEYSERSRFMPREEHRQRAKDDEVNSGMQSSMTEEHHRRRRLTEGSEYYQKKIFVERRDHYQRNSVDRESHDDASVAESEERHQKRCHRDREEHGLKSRSTADREQYSETSRSMQRDEHRKRAKDDEVKSDVQSSMEEEHHRRRRLREGSEYYQKKIFVERRDHYQRSSVDRESHDDASMTESEERHQKRSHRDKEERDCKRKRSSADSKEHSERSSFKEIKEHWAAADNKAYSGRQNSMDEKHYHSGSLRERARYYQEKKIVDRKDHRRRSSLDKEDSHPACIAEREERYQKHRHRDGEEHGL